LPRHYAKTISGTCGHAADEIHCPNDRQGANSCLLPYQLFIVQNRAAAMFASAQRTQGAWIGIAWLAPLILLMFVKKKDRDLWLYSEKNVTDAAPEQRTKGMMKRSVRTAWKKWT
jgi:hypothetical protein